MRWSRLGRLRLIAGLAAASLLIAPATFVEARAFTVRDLLHLAGFQGGYISPDGRHAILEVTGPHDQAPAFDNETDTEYALSRLYWIDLRGSEPARRLPVRSGLLAGPYSPSGRRMAVYRYAGRRLEAGILSLKDRRIRWLGRTVLRSGTGCSLQWTSERRLLLLEPRPGIYAQQLGGGAPTHVALSKLWRATASGRRAGVTRLGGGRFAVRDLPATSSLYEVDVDTGRSKWLASGRFDDLAASSSARFVALSGWEEDAPLAPHAVLGFSDILPRRRLTIVDARTGSVRRPCPDCDLISTVLSWAPKTDRLLIFARQPPHELWSEGELLEINARSEPEGRPESEPVRRLLTSLRVTLEAFGSERLPQAFVDWWGDDPIVFAHRAEAPERSDWWRIDKSGPVAITRSLLSPPSQMVARTARSTVFQVDGQLVRLSDDAPPTAALDGRVDGAASASSPAQGIRRLVGPPALDEARFAISRSQSRLLALDGSGLSVPLSPEADVIAATRGAVLEQATDARGVTEIRLQRPGRPRRVVLSINSWMAKVEPAAVRTVRHKAPNGLAATDWIYLPPHHAPGPLPMVVLPYPGFVYPSAPRAFAAGQSLLYTNAQVLAAQGFAVLVPSLPATPGSLNPAASIAVDVGAAVDAAVAAGLADPSRLAVWGHSFGGYAALITAENDPRYKAIIASAGPVDLVSLRGVFPQEVRITPEITARRESWYGWSEGGQANLRTTPWDNSQPYVANSPVFGAGRVIAPVLLVYGDQDFVGVEQGEEMFSALKRQDKDVQLLSFWGEDHLISSPANVRLYYSAVAHLLDDTIGSSPSPVPVPHSGIQVGSAVRPKPPRGAGRRRRPREDAGCE